MNLKLSHYVSAGQYYILYLTRLFDLCISSFLPLNLFFYCYTIPTMGYNLGELILNLYLSKLYGNIINNYEIHFKT